MNEHYPRRVTIEPSGDAMLLVEAFDRGSIVAMTEVEARLVTSFADDETAMLQLDAALATNVEDHALALLQPAYSALSRQRGGQCIGAVACRRRVFEAFGGRQRVHTRRERFEQQRRLVTQPAPHSLDMRAVLGGVDGTGARTRRHAELRRGTRGVAGISFGTGRAAA